MCICIWPTHVVPRGSGPIKGEGGRWSVLITLSAVVALSLSPSLSRSVSNKGCLSTKSSTRNLHA